MGEEIVASPTKNETLKNKTGFKEEKTEEESTSNVLSDLRKKC